jgi:hypothetical protein
MNYALRENGVLQQIGRLFSQTDHCRTGWLYGSLLLPWSQKLPCLTYGVQSSTVTVTRKLLQQIERIHRLPKAQQRFVMQMIDTVLRQATR